jgi:hypothetical protein
MYATIFQAIENGDNPIAAAKKVKDSGKFGAWTDADLKQNVQIATDYAKENAAALQAEQDYNTKNAAHQASYTMPDGSKSKNTPLGGTDINATASEYDLLGQPDVAQVLDQYMRSRPDFQPTKVVPASQNPKGGGFDFTKAGGTPLPPKAASTQIWGGGSTGGYDFGNTTVPAPVDPANRTSPGFNWQDTKNVVIPEKKNAFVQDFARNSIERRLGDAKNTQIRSDANRNSMQRVSAMLAYMMGGGK